MFKPESTVLYRLFAMTLSSDPLRTHRYVCLFDVLLIVTVVAGTRLYGIRQQSVWMDEYLSANYLEAPGLWAFLSEQRHENWEMAPVYYVVQYYWAKAVPGSIAWVRLLSVIFSAGAGLLLYGMGRHYFGRGAGLTAALLFAFSPFQMFHGQEIRPYALMTLLALGSSAAFLAWREGGRQRFLIAHIGANALLLWTHLLSPLLFMAQGACLVLSRPRDVRRWAPWMLAHGLILTSILVVVLTLTPAPDPNVPTPPIGNAWRLVSELAPPYDGSLLHKLFLNEGEYIRWTIGFPSKYGGSGLSPLAETLILLQHPVELALGRLSLLALMCILSLWALRRVAPYPRPARRQQNNEVIGYIMTCCLVPLLLLFLLSQFWKPHIFQSRYIIYIWPCLYLLCGIATRLLPSGAVRLLLAVPLISAMIVLGLCNVLLPIRIDYLGAARHISENTTPSVLLFDDYNTLRLLRFNKNAAEAPYVLAHDMDWLISRLDDELRAGNEACVVFFGVASAWNRNVLQLHAARQGYQVEWRPFLGMQNLYVYRVRPDARADAAQRPENASGVRSAPI